MKKPSWGSIYSARRFYGCILASLIINGKLNTVNAKKQVVLQQGNLENIGSHVK
jgi:hypothetical protein